MRLLRRSLACSCVLALCLSLVVFSASADDATIVVTQPKSAYTYSLEDGQGNNYDHKEIVWDGGWNYPSITVTSTRTLTFTANCSYTLQPGYTYDFQWDCYVSGSLWPVTLDLGFYTINASGIQKNNPINLTSSPSAGGAGYYTYHCYITPSEPVTYSLTWRILLTSGTSRTGQCQYRLPYITCTNDTIANSNQNKDEIINNQNKAKDEIIANQDENTEKVGGWLSQLARSIQGWFSDLLNGILEGLKNLFIPSQEKLDSFFAALNNWMDDHFGFLYYPFSVLIDFCNRLLTYNPPDNPSITFPALTVGEYTLFEAQEYSLATEALPGMGQWRQWYVIGVNCIIGFWLVNLARIKLNSIMSGGGDG